MCAMPAANGTTGGRCRSGTTCETGATCSPELTRNPMTGTPLTLENTFVIPIFTADHEDPDHPGEFIVVTPVPADRQINIGFGPGGQCSPLCTLATTAMPNPPNTCGNCATCSASLGGPPAIGALGVTTRTFVDINMDNTGDPICRQDCNFDPATNGGCPMGYTCDPTENICLESCTQDSQCQMGFGNSRHEGLVAVLDPAFTCNMTTGRCQWTPPAGAAAGSACESNADCPADIGTCFLGGHCATYQCNVPDPADTTGMTPLHPCPTGSLCIGFGGNDAAACLVGCNAPTDCPAGEACSPLMGTAGGFTGICFGICDNDGQCHGNERCKVGGFQTPAIGTCQPFCSPGASLPGATECTAGTQVCVQSTTGTTTVGYCQDLNALCGDDTNCYGGQSCQIINNDGSGRCVGPADGGGCMADGDCAATGAGATCRRVRYCRDNTTNERLGACSVTGACAGTTAHPAQTCEPADLSMSPPGVCRGLAGVCSPSRRLGDGTILFDLRGDLQCGNSQVCGTSATNPVAPAADALGVCVDCGGAGQRCCFGNTCTTGTCGSTGMCPAAPSGRRGPCLVMTPPAPPPSQFLPPPQSPFMSWQ